MRVPGRRVSSERRAYGVKGSRLGGFRGLGVSGFRVWGSLPAPLEK